MKLLLSFHLSFHQVSLGPTGAYWLDNGPDLSCQESTRQHAVDDPLLSCKQQVGGSSPLASSPTRAAAGLAGQQRVLEHNWELDF
jgi:hypothetical protein